MDTEENVRHPYTIQTGAAKQRLDDERGLDMARTQKANHPSGVAALSRVPRAWYRKYLDNYELLLLFLPTFLCLLFFIYIPIGGVVMAFKDYKVSMASIWEAPWVGLKHFEKLFTSLSFKPVMGNTIKISLLRLLFGFPAPVIFALMLNELRGTYKKISQTISYLPHFLSWVILYGVFVQFLSPTSGPLNEIIKRLGGKSIYFLGSKTWFVPTIIVTGIWQSMGWGSVVYLAAIAGISVEQYESAVIDGATRFQKMVHITLPSILPTVVIMLIMQTGNILNAGFDQIFNMYNDAVLSVADILDTYVYRQGLQNMNYSFSTAVGLLKNVIGFAMVLGTNFIVRRLTDKEMGIW